VVIDLFSRRVVGWSMRSNLHCDQVVDALEMAWFTVLIAGGSLPVGQRSGFPVPAKDFHEALAGLSPDEALLSPGVASKSCGSLLAASRKRVCPARFHRVR